MRALTTADLLTIWEQGTSRSPLQRALLLLTAVFPDTPPDSLAQLSIGQRNARLLSVREQLFGTRLEGFVACPQCGDSLELAFAADDVRAPDGASADNAHTFTAADYTLTFRLPDSRDLAALKEGDAPRQLLSRCVQTVTRQGEAQALDEVETAVLDQLVTHMGRLDPQADVRLDVVCPACEHQWSASFDILSFLWRELDRWAIRMLYQVHLLATAYGWHETDILRLSPWRRQFYLQMVNS